MKPAPGIAVLAVLILSLGAILDDLRKALEKSRSSR
jgi:hypothetical protein